MECIPLHRWERPSCPVCNRHTWRSPRPASGSGARCPRSSRLKARRTGHAVGWAPRWMAGRARHGACSRGCLPPRRAIRRPAQQLAPAAHSALLPAMSGHLQTWQLHTRRATLPEPSPAVQTPPPHGQSS
eukprot:scaffold1071_cov113-Isochrysis_galbana.AAC.6